MLACNYYLVFKEQDKKFLNFSAWLKFYRDANLILFKNLIIFIFWRIPGSNR